MKLMRLKKGGHVVRELDNVQIEISEEMARTLSEIVKCDVNELNKELGKIAGAATEEYVKMMLGEKVFTRGSDIREYRLYLLIIKYFEGNIPDESTISTLFQTTHSESKSLLRSTLAKYHYLLKDAINSSIIYVLSGDINQDEDGNYIVKNIPINIIDEMNRIVSEIDGSHNQIKKQRGTLQVYEIPPATFNALIKKLGVERND